MSKRRKQHITIIIMLFPEQTWSFVFILRLDSEIQKKILRLDCFRLGRKGQFRLWILKTDQETNMLTTR